MSGGWGSCCTPRRCAPASTSGPSLRPFLSVVWSSWEFIWRLPLSSTRCMPNAESQEFSGPFHALNYLKPALVFSVPTIVFLAGVSFAIGEWTRRPVLVFLLPVAIVLLDGFFLWDWSPSWLDPRVDYALMLIDSAGFRWLNETWLKVDRGVDFYNNAAIPFDWGFLASRAVFVALGFLAVGLSASVTSRRGCAALSRDGRGSVRSVRFGRGDHEGGQAGRSAGVAGHGDGAAGLSYGGLARREDRADRAAVEPGALSVHSVDLAADRGDGAHRGGVSGHVALGHAGRLRGADDGDACNVPVPASAVLRGRDARAGTIDRGWRRSLLRRRSAAVRCSWARALRWG